MAAKFETFQVNLLCDEINGLITLPKVAFENLANGMNRYPVRLLTVGGTRSGLDDINFYSYDVSSDTWSIATRYGGLNWRDISCGRELSVALFDEDKLLVAFIGGQNVSTPGAFIFDLATPSKKKQITRFSSDDAAFFAMRRGASFITLHNGRVLRFGGSVANIYATSRRPFPAHAMFDPATRAWSVVNIRMPLLVDALCVVLESGDVLVTGGIEIEDPTAAGGQTLSNNKCYILDMVSGTVRETGRMGVGRARHGGCLMANGNVYVSGGTITGEPTGLRHCEEYDIVRGEWSVREMLPGGRLDHTCTLVGDTKIMITGGADHGMTPSYMYDTATQKFTLTAQLPLLYFSYYRTVALYE